LAPPDDQVTLARLTTDQLEAFDTWSDNRDRFIQGGATIPRPYVQFASASAIGESDQVTGSHNALIVHSNREHRGHGYAPPSSHSVAYYGTGLPRGVDHYVPGIYDLDHYGDWVDYHGTACWHPTYVEDDWRPYHDGYWADWNNEPCWDDDEDWGY